MLNRKGLLLVVSGPSGAGKGTICKALLNKNDQIKLSVSATTRKPRNGEVHGVNYFFIEKEEFTKMIENGEFLEYAQIYDNFYGFHSRFYIFLLLLFIGIYYNVMIPESKVRKPMQACLRECKHVAIWYQRGII